jgi:repressor LexA
MSIAMLEPLGTRIRRQRRRHGLTLDDLAAKTGISKPYLSLIETGRVANPPSDDKVRRIEMALQFTPGELLAQAQLIRTPKEVRAMLKELMCGEGSGVRDPGAEDEGAETGARAATLVPSRPSPGAGRQSVPANQKSEIGHRKSPFPLSLDTAYLSGLLQQIADRQGSNIDVPMQTQAVPVVNKVSAGYPKDFTDMSYPRGVADAYVSAPDLRDPDAFAARVFGDSMSPRYKPGDIVVFSPAAPFGEGADCFIRFEDGQTTFKRVYTEKTVDGVERLRLEARNPKYAPRIVDAERITGLYRAVCRYEQLE